MAGKSEKLVKVRLVKVFLVNVHESIDGLEQVSTGWLTFCKNVSPRETN